MCVLPYIFDADEHGDFKKDRKKYIYAVDQLGWTRLYLDSWASSGEYQEQSAVLAVDINIIYIQHPLDVYCK